MIIAGSGMADGGRIVQQAVPSQLYARPASRWVATFVGDANLVPGTAEGEAALTQAILSIRARGGIVVVIAHRPSAIAGVDLVLAMKEGRAVAFGPKDEVLAKVLQREPPPRPLKLVPEAGSA